MGLKNIKGVLPDYMLSIIATLEPTHMFFSKGYVRPTKVKKKNVAEDEVLQNKDDFWTGIPDETKPSKHCRIFSKSKNIDDLPIGEMSRTIKRQQDRLESLKSKQQQQSQKLMKSQWSYDKKLKQQAIRDTNMGFVFGNTNAS